MVVRLELINVMEVGGIRLVFNQEDFLPSSLYKSVGKILKPTLVVRAISV